jgi:hypothetical protein
MRTVIATTAAMLLLVSAASAQTETQEKTTTETRIDSSNNGSVKKVELVTSVATSRDLTPRTNMVLIDPVRFYSYFNASYQRAVSPVFSVGGSVMVPTQFTDASGAAITAEGRYYPGGAMFKGFHLGGNFTYSGIKHEYQQYDYDKGTSSTVSTDVPSSIGMNIGWQMYPWSDFVFDFAIGADYNLSGPDPRENRGYYGGSDLPFMNSYQGFFPTIHFGVGYAW